MALKNWRSSLLFSQLSFCEDDNILSLVVAGDIYKPIDYVALDSSVLRNESILEWAKEHFADFGFDFDKYSMLLWPMNDDIPAVEIATRINAVFPKLASVKKISPALAHGLDEVSILTFDDQVMDDSIDNSNINFSF